MSSVGWFAVSPVGWFAVSPVGWLAVSPGGGFAMSPARGAFGRIPQRGAGYDSSVMMSTTYDMSWRCSSDHHVTPQSSQTHFHTIHQPFRCRQHLKILAEYID